jgi:glyoxylase-like metal-dependent hydrolase (beta-lactamase superfamily II)
MLSALDVNFLGHPGVVASCLVEGGRDGLSIVDPGPTTALEGLRAALARRGRELAEVEAILLTHIHLDHAGAAGTIVRQHPRVRVYVHERGAPHLVDPSRLLRSAERLYGADMDRLWGAVEPVSAANVCVLRGGESVRAGGRDVEVAYTPGHASHHVSYFDPETRTALVGDTGGVRLGAWNVVLPPTPPPDIDLEAWEASLEAIGGWRPERLFLTHFGGFDGAEAHVASLRAWLREAAAIAQTVMADDGREDAARPAVFAAALRARIALRAGEEAAASYSRAVSFEQCWQGLRRYLLNRA